MIWGLGFESQKLLYSYRLQLDMIDHRQQHGRMIVMQRQSAEHERMIVKVKDEKVTHCDGEKGVIF